MKANKTINIKESTKNRLERAKQHSRETFDDVINRLFERVI